MALGIFTGHLDVERLPCQLRLLRRRLSSKCKLHRLRHRPPSRIDYVPRFPTFEGDDSIGGMCGLFSGGFTASNGADGGYTLSHSGTPAACDAGYDPDFYFGGGILGH